MRLIEFGKKNVGALIIGLSIIVGLNFERFANYSADAIYRLSGRADAERAKAELYAIQRVRERREDYAR